MADWLRGRFGIMGPSAERPEVEILVLPGKGDFSGRADCNVLIAIDPAHASTVKGGPPGAASQKRRRGRAGTLARLSGARWPEFIGCHSGHVRL